MRKSFTWTIIILSIFIWNPLPASAEEGNFEHFIEFQVSASNNKTPLWLNANKYGLSSLNGKNAYARGLCTYTNNFEPLNIDYEICGDLILPLNYRSHGYKESEYSSSIIPQQLYGELRWKNIGVMVGVKQQPMMLRDNLLSSGAQTLGINARPIPQGRLFMNDWWNIPGLGKWVAVKGHIAYGIMSDADWEEAFVGTSQNKYNRWTRYHEKAGYLQIGNLRKFPLKMTLGLEMAAQFGGTLYNDNGDDQDGYRIKPSLKLDSGIKSYWNAFVPGGGDSGETQFKNAEGNQLGSWLLRLDWETSAYCLGLYIDHFFDDHSAMFFLDYDGYGTNEEWQTKKDFRFFLYNPRDMQLGMDLHFFNISYLKGATIEYINTTYQSGPIYHDHNKGNPDHLGGMDNYYNNRTLPGWQHWGQVIGNPLFRSPQYNTDGKISCEANRFTAWHCGINGDIASILSYRLLYSFEKSLGTYRDLFKNAKNNKSFMAEVSYTMPEKTIFSGIMLRIGYGQDVGQLLGNNKGLQVTITYKK